MDLYFCGLILGSKYGFCGLKKNFWYIGIVRVKIYHYFLYFKKVRIFFCKNILLFQKIVVTLHYQNLNIKHKIKKITIMKKIINNQETKKVNEKSSANKAVKATSTVANVEKTRPRANVLNQELKTFEGSLSGVYRRLESLNAQEVPSDFKAFTSIIDGAKDDGRRLMNKDNTKYILFYCLQAIVKAYKATEDKAKKEYIDTLPKNVKNAIKSLDSVKAKKVEPSLSARQKRAKKVAKNATK